MKKISEQIITLAFYQAVNIPKGRMGGQETISYVSRNRLDTNHISIDWDKDRGFLTLTSELWGDGSVVVPFTNVRYMERGSKVVEQAAVAVPQKTNDDPLADTIVLGAPSVAKGASVESEVKLAKPRAKSKA